MTELATIPELSPIRIEQIEAKLLGIEQAECPVIHRFGGGVYIREVMLPAGLLAIGHHHKTEHMNIMLTGRATFLLPDGTTEEFIAPKMSVWPPGRKIAMVHETMIWQNIFPTNCTDVEKLEAEYLEKTDTFLNDQKQRMEIERLQHEFDREDFLKAIDELGYSPDEVGFISENKSDQIPMPSGDCSVIIANSAIEGRGVFATRNIPAMSFIGMTRIGGKRTPIGRFANHSATPNAVMKINSDLDVELISTREISGCRGGQPGEEITVDYRQVASINLPKEDTCQLLQ